jgi:hypothetical protein
VSKVSWNNKFENKSNIQVKKLNKSYRGNPIGSKNYHFLNHDYFSPVSSGNIFFSDLFNFILRKISFVLIFRLERELFVGIS